MEDGVSGFCIRAGSFRRVDNNNNGNNSGSSGTKCGRWNPTTEQVKLLTDLFMSGLRTPSTDQIQKISSELSYYGKIESKNVFYWFQNHKARERQKRRKVSFHHHKDDLNKNIPPQNSMLSSTHSKYLYLSFFFKLICMTFINEYIIERSTQVFQRDHVTYVIIKQFV